MLVNVNVKDKTYKAALADAVSLTFSAVAFEDLKDYIVTPLVDSAPAVAITGGANIDSFSTFYEANGSSALVASGMALVAAAAMTLY